MPRKRHGPDGGESEFQDPLRNYEPPKFADDLEASLHGDKVSTMPIRPFKTLGAETSVRDAMRLMADLDVACLMVVKSGKLVGIFSERDVLNKVGERFEELKDRPVRELMTPDPVSVYETDNPAKAINLMAVGGFRHVPVLDVDDKVVGILGPQRITAYLEKFLGGR